MKIRAIEDGDVEDVVAVGVHGEAPLGEVDLDALVVGAEVVGGGTVGGARWWLSGARW